MKHVSRSLLPLTATTVLVGGLTNAELIRHWPFDNSLAESVASDDGTAVGAVTYAPDRNGNPDSALSVDGPLAQYVSVPGGGGLNALSTGTIACWVKWTGTQDEGFGGSFGAILARQNNGFWSNHIIALSAADPATATLLWRPYAAFPANNAITGATPVGNDTWRHIAITFADGDHKFYLDGTLDGSGTAAPAPEDSSFIRDDASVPLGIGAWYGDGASFSTSMIDDLMIFDTVLSEGEIQALLNPSSSLQLSVQSSGNDLTFTWSSQNGKVYDLLSSTDPDSDGDPGTWALVAGKEGIAATPNTNMETITRPADPTRLYVVRERNAPPPPPIFFDDFETENGWSTGPNTGDTGTTVWQRGAPAADGFGPDSGFDGSTNCYGTNLTALYGANTDIYLRSPEIDLSTPGLTSATLSMAQFLDNDAFDPAAIRVLKSSDLSPLGDVATGLVDFKFEDNSWDEVTPMALPAAAIGEKIILEFQFSSDNDGQEFDGWYIDNVTVRAE